MILTLNQLIYWHPMARDKGSYTIRRKDLTHLTQTLSVMIVSASHLKGWSE